MLCAMSAIDLDAAVATYWSSMRVGVSDADIVAAWSAAAGAVWKDELYVADRDGATCASFLANSGQARMTSASARCWSVRSRAPRRTS
jgi:hypothetical protein